MSIIYTKWDGFNRRYSGVRIQGGIQSVFKHKVWMVWKWVSCFPVTYLNPCETEYSGEDPHFFEKELLSFQEMYLVGGAWAATGISHRLGVNVYLHSRDTTCWHYSWASLAGSARVSSSAPWLLEILFFDCMCFILCCARHVSTYSESYWTPWQQLYWCQAAPCVILRN